MRLSHTSLALKDLARLFRDGTTPTGDRALLAGFLANRDEIAFETLVARHGPMVLGVCRRVLANPHDADDAFQATFLVLVRKAGEIRDADRLGPWLYGVATRVATKARARESRRTHEALPEIVARDVSTTEQGEVRPILDSELSRISNRYRDVLVLCLLEGATVEEAAIRLDCPLGTVKSRLARGREQLRARLLRRGIAPAVAGTVVAAWPSPAVSATLIRSTVSLVGSATPLIAPSVLALSTGVLPTMVSKSTVGAIVLLCGVGLVGLGTTTLWRVQAFGQNAGSPEVKSAQEGPDQRPLNVADENLVQTRQNLKLVLLALLNYEAANGSFPPAASYGPDGLPTVSWRVAILPYLDELELYNEFRLDEPWDSPHNSMLIERMPKVFKTPHLAGENGMTRLRGFSGRGAMFEGVQGVKLADVTDGTRHTAIVGLAEKPTYWTKPDELAFTANQSLPKLDGGMKRGFLVGTAEGKPQFVPKNNENLLNFIITRNGGEVIDWPPQEQPAVGGGSGTPPAENVAEGMAASMGSGSGLRLGDFHVVASPDGLTVEQRLQRLEAKLDVVLKKLDDLTESGRQFDPRSNPLK